MKRIEEAFYNLKTCPDPKHLLWKTTDRSLLSRTVLFDVNKVHREGPEGRSGDFVELDFPRDGVIMIPVFKDAEGRERFVMERQFRHGSESVSLEFPAGLVEEGEDPKDAARRELLEETGLISNNLMHLGHVNQNSAYMNVTVDVYLATELELREGQNLDATEQIDVLTVETDYVLEHAGEGELDNGASLLALVFYLKNREK